MRGASSNIAAYLSPAVAWAERFCEARGLLVANGVSPGFRKSAQPRLLALTALNNAKKRQINRKNGKYCTLIDTAGYTADHGELDPLDKELE